MAGKDKKEKEQVHRMLKIAAIMLELRRSGKRFAAMKY
jgi:hypothetical protein